MTNPTDRPALDLPDARAAAVAAVDGFVAGIQAALDDGGHDPVAAADAYDRDMAADLLWGSPYGRALAGYQDLNAAHRSLMGRGVAARSRYEVVRVLAPAPDVALAHVRRQALTADGADDPGGFSEMALYVLVNRDGRWWLAAGQNTPVDSTAPGRERS